MHTASAYLTFTAHRLRTVDLSADRRELVRRASGIHGARAEAEAYARREGPAIVLCPDGSVVPVARERDAAEDARVAALEAEYAEQRKRLTWREASAA